MSNKALGRGLDALLTPTMNIAKDSSVGATQTHEQVLHIQTEQIQANKYQPRLAFDQEKLNELMSSIREKGVVQPVLVRRVGDGYELIAGERRLRAVKALGVEKIPAIVKNVADIDMLELSLIENIQREGLNPIEEALSFQKFITDFNFTQEKIAQALGKDRSTIANTIRLLGLPKKIQDYLSKNIISMGHAKAILALATEMDQLRVCNLVVKKSLSVRETETLILRRASGAKTVEVRRDQNITDVESQLQQFFGTRVRIMHGKKRGKIQIEYYSTEDLNRIIELLQSHPKT